MSADQLRMLLETAAADPAIAAQLTEAASAEEAQARAADLGFEVSAAEFAELVQASPAHELSDAELAGAAGGGSPSLDPMLCPTGQCRSLYGLGCG